MKETPHLKAAKSEIAAFFAAHADDEERTAYIKRIFNDDYTELLIGSDERRVGYKTYQNVLHLWEGSYLSRTSESFYDWGVIAAYYGTMLVMGEFLDDATPDGQLLLTAVPEKKAIPDAAIDAALQRNGSGFEGGKYRIYAYFSENHTAQERADFLKNEFGIGGICPALPGSRLDEWHDSKGIRFARGDSSGTQVEIRLSWSQMQSRIMGLITADHYLTPREKADMPAYQQHAEQKKREAAERDADWKSAHAASPTIQPFQKPDADLRTDAPAKPTPPPTVQMSLFPTAKQQQIEIAQAEDMKSSAFSLAQDDINQVLCAGSLFRNGKFRIMEQLARHQSAKVNADFLKNEYGLSGGSLTFSDETSGQVQYTAKGISIYKSRRGAEPDKFLPWTDAEKLIRTLIETDRYLTPEERTAYTAWKKERTEALASAGQLHAHNRRPHQEMTTEESNQLSFSQVADSHSDVPDTRSENPDVQEKMGGNLTVTRQEDALFIDRAGTEPGSGTYTDVDITVSDEVADAIQEQLPIGETLPLYGRQFTVDSVNYDSGKVNLRDETFAKHTGFPIFRVESLDFVRDALQKETHNQEQTSGKDAQPQGIKREPEAPLQNFRITEDTLPAGGPKARYARNVAAIRTLRRIESENRPATAEEQAVLSAYAGWGGVAQAFDAGDPKWQSEYAELKELLTDEDYAAARSSVLNAHYTSSTIIRAMYSGLERLGFQTGNVLEPACGTGNFFGMVPESMGASKLYGVELDGITGRIAKQLYPQADITVDGFENTDFPDEFFDLAIGNVPFGNYKLPDRRYAKSNFLIHDYFFAKSLDKVRPGGLIAFITSKGTMDKRDNTVRRYIARRADLLGAVRLPNNAFSGAGTEVTADIIFLQKRDRLTDEEPDWLFSGENEDSVTVNRYFADHPEMVLGKMEYVSGPYGQETACQPIPGANLSKQLDEAMQRLGLPDRAIFDISAPEPDGGLEEDVPSSLPADPDVRNFSYTLVDDHLYFRENSRMNLVHLPETTERRVRGMMELRDCTRKLIALQMEDAADDAIQQAQAQLNTLYDAYSKDYGLLSSQGNRRAFENDASYSLLTSLEVVDENGRLERKADMFSKRTIRHAQPVTSVDTASDALAVSIAEQAGVDMAYMQELTGFSEEKLAEDLTGVIFRNLGDADPATVPKAFVKLEAFPYVTADEYLSGNVRAKLRMAKALAEMRPDLAEQIAPNIVALEKVQPKDLSAGEIDVRLGVTWIEPMYIDQFMADVLKTPRVLLLNSIHTQYADVSGVWNIRGKSADSMDNVRVHATYGTKRRNAYYILEDSLNLKDVRIFDTVLDAEGREHRVLNGKETAIAQQKQDALRQAFQDWIWKDPDRRQTLVKKYNELFNSTRPREYDGQHIVFNGMNPEIQLRPYQRNAVAHVLYGHNALLAHCVGAGKTYEMIASAMESKRLGLCNKALFVVPNHLTEQWGSDFLRLYPGANVLVATRKDFEPANRKRFCARIATGDYDAVIIGHSQFEKIPVSPERQARTIQRQIDDIELALEQVSNEDGQRYTVKQLENTRKSLEARLKKLNDTERKDNVVTFEELGVDRLFVDEADTYKNLFLFTKMRNVAGIGQTEAQKSSDMFAKCQYMDELTGERGIVFATGTPISNSMVELFTMMRYLQSSMLHEHGLDQFDSWAAAFGERVTAMELKPEGSGFRAKTRFARFFNLPELMSLWKEAADIQTADMLHLPVPKAEYIDVVTKASTIQKDFVQQFGERAEKVHQNLVESYEDNMLTITNDGRKLALDQRLMNPLLPDDPDSKINACVKNVLQVWQETTEQRGAQLIFCDLSTPHNDGKFNVYDDIRAKLITNGIPAGEIAFIHEAKTETQKKELFARVRKGQVRVLLGSTAKMGAGTNCQDRLAALHHADCPWRPRDLEQREGRILRFGNKFGTVRIFRYVTQSTFDAYNWSLIENKQKFIGQVVTGKSPARSCEDVDGTALSYAEVKSLATGDPRIKQKMDLDIQVSKLRMLQASYASQKYELEDNLLKHYPQQIQATQEKIAGLTVDEKQAAAHPQQDADHFTMQVMGKTFSERKAAGEAIIAACQSIKSKDAVLQLGEYRGFAMQVAFDRLAVTFKLMLKHKLGRSVDVGADALGNITRIDHALANIPKRLNEAREHLSELQQQMEIAREEVAKPFPQEQELTEKSERLQALNALLSVDDKKSEEPKEQENPAAKKRRASEYER